MALIDAPLRLVRTTTARGFALAKGAYSAADNLREELANLLGSGDDGGSTPSNGNGATPNAGPAAARQTVPVAPPTPPPSRRASRKPAAPPVPPQAKTIDDEPELVAEFGEAGAEDPAGPEVTVAEPWEGYARLAATDVREQLTAHEAEVAAAILLFEPLHRNRRTVIQAAERRLRELQDQPG